MFGYVKIFKPDLRIRDYECYKGMYCGLCRALGKQFGPFARFTLSFDVAFLALFRAALRKEAPTPTAMRCPGNPLVRRQCYAGADLALCADLSMILSYYKILDDVRDEHGVKKWRAVLTRPYFALTRRKAAARQPACEGIIAASLARLAKSEHGAGRLTVDAYAHPFAEMMGDIAALDAAPEQVKVRRHFGYFLGKWIYLMDAVDDLARDAARGGFNPYIRQLDQLPENQRQSEASMVKIRADAAFSLTACLNEMANAYDLLEISHFRDILDNMMWQGLPEMQRQILADEGVKKHDGSVQRPGRFARCQRR